MGSEMCIRDSSPGAKPFFRLVIQVCLGRIAFVHAVKLFARIRVDHGELPIVVAIQFVELRWQILKPFELVIRTVQDPQAYRHWGHLGDLIVLTSEKVEAFWQRRDSGDLVVLAFDVPKALVNRITAPSRIDIVPPTVETRQIG